MAWPVPTPDALADWAGIPLEQYDFFAPQALFQATLLFSVTTELGDPPTDATDAALANQGILAMADHIYLNRPYRDVAASPLQDASMGSTHWSKPVSFARGTAAASAMKAELTGIMWWDLAVETLSLRTRRGGVSYGGISLMERVDQSSLVAGPNGALYILGPSDLDKSIFPIDINGDNWPGGEGINESF